MTGPQHYAKAEEALAILDVEEWLEALRTGELALALQSAQVHATLALAAAIVDGPAVMRPEDRDEWDRATGRLERDL